MVFFGLMYLSENPLPYQQDSLTLVFIRPITGFVIVFSVLNFHEIKYYQYKRRLNNHQKFIWG